MKKNSCYPYNLITDVHRTGTKIINLSCTCTMHILAKPKIYESYSTKIPEAWVWWANFNFLESFDSDLREFLEFFASFAAFSDSWFHGFAILVFAFSLIWKRFNICYYNFYRVTCYAGSLRVVLWGCPQHFVLPLRVLSCHSVSCPATVLHQMYSPPSAFLSVFVLQLATTYIFVLLLS